MLDEVKLYQVPKGSSSHFASCLSVRACKIVRPDGYFRWAECLAL